MRRPFTGDDIDWLLALAERLRGRPVPGLRMTEEQFDRWCDKEINAEWVDGEVILMSPVSLVHTRLVGWFLSVLIPFVERYDLGAILGSEYQVRLPRQRRRRIPDVLFVSKDRLNLLRPMFLDGPPDLIIEVVSAESESRDWRDKYVEYERAGVPEYWVVDPGNENVEAYGLGGGKKYRPIMEDHGRIFSAVLPGFYLRPEWLWRQPLPRVTDVLRELRRFKSARRPKRR